MPGSNPTRHTWRFFRRGGLDQVLLESAADLLALDSLDQKLWVALSCPVRGLELDERTLALIDSDGDGRIRVPELLAAIRWAAGRLKEPGVLLKGSEALPTDAIDASKPDGAAILAAARNVLASLGRPEAAALAVDEAADSAAIFPATLLNGDGVVQPEAVSDPGARSLAADIVACMGGTPDRSGPAGVTAPLIAAFFADAAAFAAWAGNGATRDVLPLGEGTAGAVAALRAVRPRIDDYFVRCRLAAFDPRAESALNRSEADFAALASRELGATGADAAAFPLSHAAPDRPLSLVRGVNPAWADALSAFRTAVVLPVFGAGTDTLTEAAWASLRATFAPYEAWDAAKAGASVEKLGLPRIRAILTGPERGILEATVARENALAPGYLALADLERLVRYHRDLRTLLHNFVNFADFYSRDRPAVFQAGTLYLDGRSTELCLRTDAPSPLWAASRLCIATCACTRPGGQTMTVAACFTQGGNDSLAVGRHGVFYDRRGRDWDAEVTGVIENPTSLREAALSPYRKFIQFVEALVARGTAAASGKSDARLATAASALIPASGGAPAASPGSAAPAAGAAAGTAPAQKIDVGTVAAIAVAAGAIGSFVTTLIGYAAGWVVHPLAIAGILLLISGPAVIIAWFKLGQRTLGPLLDANGWAINGRVKVNFALGAALTECATFPPGAKHLLNDPYDNRVESSRRRRLIAWTVLALLFWTAWRLRASLVPFYAHLLRG